MNGPLQYVFVYGTLKPGSTNYHLIEPFARSARRGWVRGELFDFGPFPALTHGESRVWGVLVEIEHERVAELLRLTDRLEHYDESDPAGSVYVREALVVTLPEGPECDAYAYRYNREPIGLLRVASGEWEGPWSASP